MLHDEARVFDLKTVLPVGFAARDPKMEKDPSLLEVRAGVITGPLQDRFVKKYGKEKPDDVCLLDQDNLSYLSSRLLGNKSKAYKNKFKKANIEPSSPSGHLGWDKILTAIESALELDKTTSAGNYSTKRKRGTSCDGENNDQSSYEIGTDMSTEDEYDDDDVVCATSEADYEDQESELYNTEIDRSTAAYDGQPGSSCMDVEYDRRTSDEESDGCDGSDDGDDEGEDNSTPVAKADTTTQPRIPKGLSQTCTEMVREVAKNVRNIWEGSLYVKLVDYTLRILLRLHLAPRREQAHHDRCRNAVTKKANDARAAGEVHSLCFKTWLSKKVDLFDQLDKALSVSDISRMNHEVPIILNLIVQHELQKPTKQARFPDLEPLDVRAAKSQSVDTKSDADEDVEDDDESVDSIDEDFQDDGKYELNQQECRHFNQF